MTDTAADRLYALLPAIMRRRDGDTGAAMAARLDIPRLPTDEDGPLKALLGILGLELDVLEAEAEALYDDHFIETCADWAVPYIGALIGARIVDTGDPASARRQVADTIANRRGKGTAGSLARRAADLMGPPAEAIEYFHHLVTALHLDYPGTGLAPYPPMSVALHGPAPPLPGDPTRIGQHLPEIRASGGTFAVPFIGVRSWPMEALIHAELVPTPVAGGDPGRFRLSPIGNDMALWRRPRADNRDLPRLSLDEIPGPLTLRDAAARPAAAWGQSIALTIDGNPVPVDAICFCNLEDAVADGSRWNMRGSADELADIRIDPERGRLMLPPALLGLTADSLRLFLHYGAAVRTGGGGYDRGMAAIGTGAARIADNQSRAAAEAALAAALADLGNRPEVAIAYGGPLAPPLLVTLPPNRSIRITADGPGVWPTLFAAGDIVIRGGAGTTLVLEGLRIAGGALDIATRSLAGLVLRDCTLVPGQALTPQGDPVAPTAPALVIRQPGLAVALERCVTGPIRCEGTVALTVTDSIVDAPDADTAAIRSLAAAPDSRGGRLTADRSTFIGDVRLASFVEISDCVFAQRHARTNSWPSVDAERLQTGCVRYSALPVDARAPRRYRCVPQEGAALPALPIFAGLRHGTASYATMVPATSPTILLGAENGGEMGAMNRVSTTRKQQALVGDLPDWTPFGHAAGVELMT